MKIKIMQELYGEELTKLLLNGLDWMADFSCVPRPRKSKHCNRKQAIIAAALQALAMGDIKAFTKIHHIENLSYIRYRRMESWLKDCHEFPKKIVARCLAALAWLVMHNRLSSQSPFVAAVTGLEEKYELCGVFAQAMIVCAKRIRMEAHSTARNEKEVSQKNVSTQTSFKENESVQESMDERSHPVFGSTNNAINANKLTPLLIALLPYNQEMVDLLTRRGALVFAKFCNRDESGSKDVLNRRLETEVEVSKQEEIETEDINNNTMTSLQDLDDDKSVPRESSKDGPIHKAAAEGRLGAVIELLDQGFDADTKGYGGFTALQYAAKYGHINIVQALLQRGADINLGNDWNWTPLHHAAHYSRCDIAEFLIEAGADTQVVDSVYGKTPLSWATCNFKMIKLFKSKGIYS